MFHRHTLRLEVFEHTGLCNSNEDLVLCLLGCAFPVVHVHPGVLVTDVCHLEPELVQSAFLCCSSERRLVETWRTRRNNNTIQVVLFDCVDDLCLSRS